MKPISITCRNLREIIPFAFRILLSCIRRFVKERNTINAAGIAFYALFSIFPLLLILLVAGSTFFEDSRAQTQILSAVLSVMPSLSQELILENITQILQVRSTVGIIGFISFIWSTFSAFIILIHSLNRAWVHADSYSLMGSRLAAMVIVLIIMLLTVVLSLAKEVFDIFRDAGWFRILSSYFIIERRMVLKLLIYLGVLASMILLYRWIPNARVRWREAVGGALFASVLFVIVTGLFGSYMDSGISKYNVIYGSVGTILAFLFWVYLVNLIVLFGAFLASSIAYHTRRDSMVPS